MQAQAKFMKATWTSAHGGGVCIKFTFSEKILDYCKYMNILVASGVAKALKMNKIIKLRIRTTLNHKTSQEILTSKIWRL